MQKSKELTNTEAEALEKAKFDHWKMILSAVRDLVKEQKGLKLEEIPSRSLFIRRSEFPASKVTASMSLDGQRIELHWVVRERVGGLVQEASDTG